MSGKKDERERSSLTMASYACNRHHRWRTHAAWTNVTCINYQCRKIDLLTSFCVHKKLATVNVIKLNGSDKKCNLYVIIIHLHVM